MQQEGGGFEDVYIHSTELWKTYIFVAFVHLNANAKECENCVLALSILCRQWPKTAATAQQAQSGQRRQRQGLLIWSLLMSVTLPITSVIYDQWAVIYVLTLSRKDQKGPSPNQPNTGTNNNCFKPNTSGWEMEVGLTSERQPGAHMGFPERVDL